MYLIEILHQTTTISVHSIWSSSCILSKFYIKPQLFRKAISFPPVVSYRNSTSNHTLTAKLPGEFFVVSYRNSTSNHNSEPRNVSPRHSCILSKFYIKPQLLGSSRMPPLSCILSKFYIKPQLLLPRVIRLYCCILSKFYIKPQQPSPHRRKAVVVSYRNSTSNHNKIDTPLSITEVVSYRNSTSNHNPPKAVVREPIVVSYRNSTSNHNPARELPRRGVLYLIEILHQTTTFWSPIRWLLCCILSKFYIKPQPIRLWNDVGLGLYLIEILHQTTTSWSPIRWLLCCILSKFYIKPQPTLRVSFILRRCILSKFYIKPQQ